MRIGEINRDNYKMFLSMLGAKSTKTLDKLMGADEKPAEKELSHEEMEEKFFQMGYITEKGLMPKPGDNSWKRIVPVTDEVNDKIIATVRRQFLENGNGMSKPGGVDGDELGAIMKEYRKNIPVNERLSVTWTLSQISSNEERRLTDYIKSKDPSWSVGKPFDRNLLLNSDFGTNSVDVKA